MTDKCNTHTCAVMDDGDESSVARSGLFFSLEGGFLRDDNGR